MSLEAFLTVLLGGGGAVVGVVALAVRGYAAARKAALDALSGCIRESLAIEIARLDDRLDRLSSSIKDNDRRFDDVDKSLSALKGYVETETASTAQTQKDLLAELRKDFVTRETLDDKLAAVWPEARRKPKTPQASE
jgi:hypothetical protein